MGERKTCFIFENALSSPGRRGGDLRMGRGGGAEEKKGETHLTARLRQDSFFSAKGVQEWA